MFMDIPLHCNLLAIELARSQHYQGQLHCGIIFRGRAVPLAPLVNQTVAIIVLVVKADLLFALTLAFPLHTLGSRIARALIRTGRAVFAAAPTAYPITADLAEGAKRWVYVPVVLAHVADIVAAIAILKANFVAKTAAGGLGATGAITALGRFADPFHALIALEAIGVGLTFGISGAAYLSGATADIGQPLSPVRTPPLRSCGVRWIAPASVNQTVVLRRVAVLGAIAIVLAFAAFPISTIRAIVLLL